MKNEQIDKVQYEAFERRKVKWDPEDMDKMKRYHDILDITLPPIINFWDSPSSIPVLSVIISFFFYLKTVLQTLGTKIDLGCLEMTP